MTHEELVAEARAAKEAGVQMQAADAVPNARSVVYVVTCAQCSFKAQETFEGITVAGWVMRQDHDGKIDAFCPSCVYGLPRA